jgi:hypothetical protein
MVHCEDDRAALKHPLPMNYTKTKKQSANEAAKLIPEPVIEIHLSGKRFTDLAIRFHSILNL